MNTGALACATEITHCFIYKENGKCKTCSTSKNLTDGALAFVTEIAQCSIYEDNGKCQTCLTQRNWPLKL